MVHQPERLRVWVTHTPEALSMMGEALLSETNPLIELWDACQVKRRPDFRSFIWTLWAGVFTKNSGYLARSRDWISL